MTLLVFFSLVCFFVRAPTCLILRLALAGCVSRPSLNILACESLVPSSPSCFHLPLLLIM